MRQAPRSFSRFSTRDSYIALSCAMKDQPAFKPLQGNPTFFRVRASQYPLYLRQQTQGPSHIPIAEGRVLWWCLWKVGLLLQQNPGNPLLPRDHMVSRQLSSYSCAEIGVPLDWRRYITESLQLPKVRQTTCLVGWGTGDYTRYNTGEFGVIANCFGLHRKISHSFGYISVILDM